HGPLSGPARLGPSATSPPRPPATPKGNGIATSPSLLGYSVCLVASARGVGRQIPMASSPLRLSRFCGALPLHHRDAKGAGGAGRYSWDQTTFRLLPLRRTGTFTNAPSAVCSWVVGSGSTDEMDSEPDEEFARSKAVR